MTFHDRLLSLPGFQERLKELTIRSVAAGFDPLSSSDPFKDVGWAYLLRCASALAYSDKGKCQAAALRIAHACLTAKDTSEEERAAAGIVLNTLTNYPALDLAFKKTLLAHDFQKRLPVPLRCDVVARAIGSSLPGKEGVFLTRFQKGLFVALEESQYVSVSAPTSAGKSFVLTQFVAHFISRADQAKVAFIVPTRALIQQFEEDFRTATAKLDPKPLVTSVPQLPDEWQSNKCIFVLTQERYHWILSSAPATFKLDLLVVDEAHKVGDASRGILLQQVIEETRQRSPRVRLLFSSPLSSNPGILLQHFAREGAGRTISSDDVTVNQNLIWVNEVGGRPVEWTASLCVEDEVLPLGDFRLPARATSIGKRLPLVAFALAGASAGNLIYMNGQAEAEKAARVVFDLMGKDRTTDDPEIAELIKLVQKVVHKDYALASVLERRVAFHYGNMPLVIRAEIERLFKEGKLQYLLCTSTLLEGVNLPARSIFVRAPKRGKGKPMNAIDFWNLAGRAGRLGKEFQGNVICVDASDPEVWGRTPPKQRAVYDIKFAFDEVMAQSADLAQFLRDGAPRDIARKSPGVEQAGVYLLNRYMAQKSLVESDLAARVPRLALVELEEECRAVLGKVEIAETIVRRNPGISPLAQQALLKYFRESGKDPRELMPVLPESKDAAKDSYVKIIGRINKYLSGETPGPRDIYLAILVVNWMRGYPLAAIIAENAKYWGSKKSLASVIRDTMRDIEEYARFTFVKYSSCYIDVLKLHFQQLGLHSLVSEMPELNIWLEFGASQNTQIALISLGVSRTAAIAVAEFIAQDNLTRAQCGEWIKNTNLQSLDLSPILLRELLRVKQEIESF